MDYAKTLTQTPQSRPLVGENMIKNNAGGYVFETTKQQQLERFLLIGSETPTYYCNEQKLTEDNAKSIIEMIKTNGVDVIDIVYRFASENRAPKMEPTLFVLALVCTHGDEASKNIAYNIIATVCKTGTHILTFVSQVNQLRGWSAGLRKGVAKWYTSKDDNKLGYQLVKYRNRADFTHRDVMRLAHPKAQTSTQNNLFKYAVDKYEFNIDKDGVEVVLNGEQLPIIVSAFQLAMQSSNAKEISNLIKLHNLTWEMIPTQFLNEPTVLTSLLEKMPTIAMIRNLNRFAKADMTNGLTETTKTILSKLDKESILNSRVHPVNLINSLRTYASGHGDKGSSTWPVNQNIVAALEEAYEFALQNITPTGKTLLVALDVSGSMNAPVTKTSLTATQLGCVLSVTIAKTEKFSEVIGFDTKFQPIPVGRSTTIASACKAQTSGGGTDCAVPFAHALDNKIKYDAIIILTDNETWAGPKHGITLLNEYRKKINKDVKVIEIAMVSNPYTTLPQNDPNILRIVGFDSNVPQLINEFLK